MVRPTTPRLGPSSVLPALLVIALAAYSILAAAHPYRDQRLATSLVLFGASLFMTFVMAALLWARFRGSGLALGLVALVLAAAAVFILVH